MVNSLLSDNSQDLITQLQTNDIKQTTSFITSLTSILDNQQVAFNSSDSTQEESFSDKNTKIKEVLINVMTSIPANNVDNIILISNTLSILTNKPNEINSNSADMASKKTQELANNLLELSSSLPLNIIHETSNSIVNSITNCLLGSIQQTQNINSTNDITTNTTSSSSSNQIFDLYKKSMNILNQIANMTSSKLSLNQDLQTKTNVMELNFKKSLLNDFNTNSVKSSEGEVKIPNLCNSLNLNNVECSNQIVTSQVNF